jgi:hypothetical protein
MYPLLHAHELAERAAALEPEQCPPERVCHIIA